MRYLISGGGTGGHIFPAISIANALKEIDPECEILFVGANNRMEMQRVPQAGYKIVGLPVRGFDRSKPWKNISVLIDLMKSMLQARKIIKEFKPDAGIGVGGYASGAAMKVAAKMGIPILLQEQNGFAGVTNKLLKDDAQVICVAYEGMERFFPKEKIILTGNPVRQDLAKGTKAEALTHFGLSADKPILLIIGGSLGARTINQSVIAGIEQIASAGIQVIWQTGKNYIDDCRKALSEKAQANGEKNYLLGNSTIWVSDFVSRMDLAYAAADLVISRAGASSISELCLLGKPCILVPSPNVAEDHQTHNAMALVKHDAAIMIRDAEAKEKLVSEALELLKNSEKLGKLADNIKSLGQHDSAKRIAQEVQKMIKNTHKTDK